MWQFVFWACVAVVAYSYFIYPLALFLIVALRRRGTTPPTEIDQPRVCLIISAFNEEKIIRKKIENSLDLKYPADRLRILVASDGSNDATVAIAREYAEYGVAVFHRAARTGKSAVLNDVVREIDEEIVVFTDANSLFSDDAMTKLVRHFADPAIGCVVGKLRYVDRHTSAVGKGEGLYWRYEGLLSRLESALRSVLVANGAFFGIRRSLFAELYAEVANDFQIPVEVGSQGYGIVYEPEALAFERSTIFWQEEFQRKVRIILRGLTGFSRMRHKIRGLRLWQFFSHKLLRWVIGPVMFVALLSNAMLTEGSPFYTTLLFVQLLFYGAAINGWRMRRTRRPHPIFYLPFYFTMVNTAAVFAMAKFISGERQSVWEKAESARFAPGATNAPRPIREPQRVVVSEDQDFEPAPLQRVAKN